MKRKEGKMSRGQKLVGKPEKKEREVGEEDKDEEAGEARSCLGERSREEEITGWGERKEKEAEECERTGTQPGAGGTKLFG